MPTLTTVMTTDRNLKNNNNLTLFTITNVYPKMFYDFNKFEKII